MKMGVYRDTYWAVDHLEPIGCHGHGHHMKVEMHMAFQIPIDV